MIDISNFINEANSSWKISKAYTPTNNSRFLWVVPSGFTYGFLTIADVKDDSPEPDKILGLKPGECYTHKPDDDSGHVEYFLRITE